MTIDDRDALIRLAITPPAEAVAPADLGDAIYRDVLATPQRRGLVPLRRLGWLPMPSPLVVTLALLALLAVAIIVAGLLQPAPPLLTTYHGGPDRTGVMPGPGPAGLPVRAWDVGRQGALPFTSMPLPVGDRVFVADTGGFLAALDVETGRVLWERDVDGAVYGAPSLASELVVVGTESGEVVAARAATGELAWRTQLDAGAVLASLLVADEVIYAGTEGGSLVAVAPSDGHVLWSVATGDAVTRGPAFADGVIYIGTAGGNLAAIDVTTHGERWRVHLGPGEVGTPAVADGRIYVGRGLLGLEPIHDLVAIDVRDGSTVWAFPSPEGAQVHVGAIAHGRVYAVSEDGNLSALDPATGTPVWTTPIGGRLTTLATVAGDVVFVSSEPGAVVAVDAATGTELWRLQVVGVPTMAAVVGGRAFVGTSLGRVVSIGGSSAGS